MDNMERNSSVYSRLWFGERGRVNLAFRSLETQVENLNLAPPPLVLDSS